MEIEPMYEPDEPEIYEPDEPKPSLGQAQADRIVPQVPGAIESDFWDSLAMVGQMAGNVSDRYALNVLRDFMATGGV
jgi:hypothetical protein